MSDTRSTLAAIEESKRSGALKVLAESGYSVADIVVPNLSGVEWGGMPWHRKDEVLPSLEDACKRLRNYLNARANDYTGGDRISAYLGSQFDHAELNPADLRVILSAASAVVVEGGQS